VLANLVAGDCGRVIGRNRIYYTLKAQLSYVRPLSNTKVTIHYMKIYFSKVMMFRCDEHVLGSVWSWMGVSLGQSDS